MRLKVKTGRTIMRKCAVLVFALALAQGSAHAAQCVSSLGAAPRSAIDSFGENPAGLLQRHETAGFLLVKDVRELVLSNSDLAKSVAEVAKSASNDQIEAIGIGLGQAATACAKTNSEAGQ